MPFLTTTHYIGAAVGFLIGVGGYIVIKFWIRPISSYSKTKQRLAAALEIYPIILEGQENPSEAASIAKRFRRSAADLTNAFEHELPSWYRLKLASRGEKPSEASGWLMKLANTKNADHAKKQIASIRELLQL